MSKWQERVREILERGPATVSQLAFELGLHEQYPPEKAGWWAHAYVACEIKNERICQLEDGTLLLLSGT